jgi:hypothetical protein
MLDALGQRFNSDDKLRVWLDDDLVDRRAPDGWVHLRTAREVCLLLLTGNVCELSLDNDLHGDTEFGQGFQVIDFLEEMHALGRPLWPKEGIRLHTANPSGRERMERSFQSLERNLGLSVEKSFSSGTKPIFFVREKDE